MAKQLHSYIDRDGFPNVNQSIYRILHSTEKVLFKDYIPLKDYDIATSIDPGKAVALSGNLFVVDGTLLMWIRSYLINFKRMVKLGNSFSDEFSLPCSVP